MHEQNPMLGLRGVRLDLVIPGLFGMQVRAIAHAAAQLKRAGRDPRPLIETPLVAAVQEMEIARGLTEQVLQEVEAETGVHLRHPDRHDDRGAPGRADRRADRPQRRVLLLRHERPDPDDLGLLPR